MPGPTVDATDRRTPTFEGRPLPHPDEPVFDQGLAFDVDTLISRRQVLRALGYGAVGRRARLGRRLRRPQRARTSAPGDGVPDGCIDGRAARPLPPARTTAR